MEPPSDVETPDTTTPSVEFTAPTAESTPPTAESTPPTDEITMPIIEGSEGTPPTIDDITNAMEPPSVDDMNSPPLPIFQEPANAESSLPTVEEARFNAALNGSNPYSGKRKRQYALVAIMAAALVAIIGFSVGIAQKNSSARSKSSASGQNSGPSNPGYPGPNNGDVGDEDEPPAAPSRLGQVQDFIVSRGISSRGEFLIPSTPQFMASKWVADEDGLKREIPTSPENAYLLEQRYILAVMYFSLMGPNWKYNLSFLTAKNECRWNFRLTSTQRPRVTEELEWEMGVQCDDKGQVNEIFITGNDLTGQLPRELGHLTGLEHLSLFNNNISGELPESMRQLTKLKFVAMESNMLTGELPLWLSLWSNVEELALGDNQFSGTIPLLEGLSNLKEVALDYNQLTGNLHGLHNIATLEHVFLNDNAFDGRLHEQAFSAATNLDILDLSDNLLSGQFPQHFYNARIVDVHNNSLAGELPAVPSGNFRMEFLSVYNNDLSGSIPNSLGFLSNLYHLDMSDNNLGGEIVSSLNALVNLEYLFLGENPLTAGPIPTLNNLINLKELSLVGASRTGVLPTWLGSLSNLVLLDLHRNELSGSIPSQLGSLPNLAFMMLNRNFLTGTVPTSLNNLSKLVMITLDKNRLTGDVGFCGATGLTGLQFSAADCTAEVDCECCTICCVDHNDGCNTAKWQVSFDTGYVRDQFVFSEDLVFDISGNIN